MFKKFLMSIRNIITSYLESEEFKKMLKSTISLIVDELVDLVQKEKNTKTS